MNFLDTIIQSYHYYADKVPLEIFTFVGAFSRRSDCSYSIASCINLGQVCCTGSGLSSNLFIVDFSGLAQFGANALHIFCILLLSKAEDIIFVKLENF